LPGAAADRAIGIARLWHLPLQIVDLSPAVYKENKHYYTSNPFPSKKNTSNPSSVLMAHDDMKNNFSI
jgi:hypothetical protein